MTDEQWLNAIARYSKNNVRFMRSGEPVGGAHELATLLSARVKEGPARYAKLAYRFPDDAHPAYFDAVLQGIADAGLDDMHLVLEVCTRCHQLPNRPGGR